MKSCMIMGLFVILLLGVCILRGSKASGGEAKPILPDVVLIDRQEPAYTVFMSIPKDKLAEVRAKIAKLEHVALVNWEKFQREAGQYITARVVKNDYPEFDVVKGLAALLKNFASTPIGLTWNGGVAFTANDYQYAQKIYQHYQAQPAESERTRKRDPKADPLNPGTQFQGLLGNAYRKEEK